MGPTLPSSSSLSRSALHSGFHNLRRVLTLTQWQRCALWWMLLTVWLKPGSVLLSLSSLSSTPASLPLAAGLAAARRSTSWRRERSPTPWLQPRRGGERLQTDRERGIEIDIDERCHLHYM